MERTFKKLISKKNLRLAWRRIVCTRNSQYKKIFRSLYYAYELAFEENIDHLHKKLLGNWKPSTPLFIHLPKPSGLQRTITLLKIEDQIVLQAIANIFADKIYTRRKKLENKVVFSNLLSKPKGSIFLIENWQKGYGKFKKKSESFFNKGDKWVIDFDLAAFYDTISHSLLTKVVSPKGGQFETWTTVKDWLQTWSSLDPSLLYEHGIPQGPAASNLLAECFLLDLDELMYKNKTPYLRYVDDIRIFASSKSQAYKAVVELDKFCKTKGLIPHSNKLIIKKRKSLGEVLSSMPSLSGEMSSIIEDEDCPSIDVKEAESLLKSSISGKPFKIINKTIFTYVIYRSPKSQKILGWVNLLLPRHPEHIDAFSNYLRKFGKSKTTERMIVKILKESTIPYDYVNGELLRILARIASKQTMKSMLNLAKEASECTSNSPMLRWGACQFLLVCESNLLFKAKRTILKQKPLIQSLLVPYIGDADYCRGGLVKNLLLSRNYEPGIILAEEFVKRKKKHLDFGIRIREMPAQVQNTFRTLQIIKKGGNVKIDQISDILVERYKIKSSTIWSSILGSEYIHALQILLQSDKIYDAAPSTWLPLQDSFNDVLTRSLAAYFTRKGMPSQRTIDSKGKIIDIGVLLSPSQTLCRSYPQIFGELRLVHTRRSSLPSSHAYEKRTGKRTSYLRHRGRKKFKDALRRAYSKIVTLVESNGL